MQRGGDGNVSALGVATVCVMGEVVVVYQDNVLISKMLYIVESRVTNLFFCKVNGCFKYVLLGDRFDKQTEEPM